jgi:hypothetical protein
MGENLRKTENRKRYLLKKFGEKNSLKNYYPIVVNMWINWG